MKRLLTSTLLAGLFCFSNTGEAQEIIRDNIHVSLGKPVTAVGHARGGVPEHAVDGDAQTRWRVPTREISEDGSAWGKPAWLKVDLGDVHTLEKIEVMPEGKRPYQYIVEASRDGVDFQRIVDRRGNREEREIIVDQVDRVPARYVRLSIEGIEGGRSSWASIHQFNVWAAPQEETLIVSGPARVHDTQLRRGDYWGKWNYGDGQYLQVGYKPAIVYDFVRTKSLLRFDLAGLPKMDVESAKVLLYVPKNLTQMQPLALHLHRISDANAGWKEGSSEASREPEAATWSELAEGVSWAGGPGLAVPGVDFSTKPLASRIADGDEGTWLEFELPGDLVRQWMDDPDSNGGLLIRGDDDLELGQHTHIAASEHWTGKGPRLVVTGKFLEEKVPESIHTLVTPNPTLAFPPPLPLYERWLRERGTRYTNWAQDPMIGMDEMQRKFPYLWDIMVRARITLPNAMLQLRDLFEEIPEIVRNNDEERAREAMTDFFGYMKVLDYSRAQNWYNAGPVVEHISPLQIARFFVRPPEEVEISGVVGIYSRFNDGRWQREYTEEDLEKEIAAKIERVSRRFQYEPGSEAGEALEGAVRELLPIEWKYRSELQLAMDEVFKLIDEENDGPEMMAQLRRLFFAHRMHLIYQSFFSRPFFDVFMEHAPMVAYANWVYDIRENQYSRPRVGNQIVAVKRFMWEPTEFHEAEYGRFEGAEWSNERSGHTGTGHVTFNGEPGGFLELEVEVEEKGKHEFVFRYGLNGGRELELLLAIGGIILDRPLRPAATAEGEWAEAGATVRLLPGTYRVRLIAVGDATGLDVDAMELRRME